MLFRKYRLLLLVLTLASGLAHGEALHIVHCLSDCPVGTPRSNEIIVRNLFAVSINRDTGLADWVSYRVLRDTIGVASLLPREWHADDLVQSGMRTDMLGTGGTTGQPVLDNQQDQAYRLTEFTINASDQGRLVPMTSFAGTSYWQDLNYLSVMAPLKADMRSGPWSRLDQAVNQLARKSGEVFVVVGPIMDGQSTPRVDSAGQSDLPAAYFKVIADYSGRLSAFIFAQGLAPHVSFCDQLSSLAEVEQRSGLDLFPATDDWPTASFDAELGCSSGE